MAGVIRSCSSRTVSVSKCYDLYKPVIIVNQVFNSGKQRLVCRRACHFFLVSKKITFKKQNVCVVIKSDSFTLLGRFSKNLFESSGSINISRDRSNPSCWFCRSWGKFLFRSSIHCLRGENQNVNLHFHLSCNFGRLKSASSCTKSVRDAGSAVVTLKGAWLSLIKTPFDRKRRGNFSR